MRNLAVLLLLLAACTPAVKPTPAPSPTAIPMLTGTPVPPLVAHEWSQSAPLITYGKAFGGLNWDRFDAVYPMDLTLLPSGDLYLLRTKENRQADEILTTTLSRQATCNLLNSIDQAGFFDYDPSSYGRQSPMDAGTTYISVHAWRANSVSLYDLYDVLDQETRNPPDRGILSAIRDTYHLLDRYQPPGPLHALELERLGVWLMGQGDNDLTEWPLKSDPLAAVAPTDRRVSGPPSMILTGANATQVYDAFHQRILRHGMSFQEHGLLYAVFARPLLPNEFNSSPLPKVSMSCSPLDGWIQAP